MEVGLKKESPITYSNGKRLFTIDQKVDALVRIKMTGCSKAEVARSLHVAESTFRGWFKNKDIVMKAEAKYNEMKSKTSSAASSDGYKSDDNSDKSLSVVDDVSDNNSSTCYTDDREGSRSRFSSPDPCAINAVRPSPERNMQQLQNQQLQKQKLKNKHLNNGLNNNNNYSSNNNNNNNNSSSSSSNSTNGLNVGVQGLNASLTANLSASLSAANLSASLNAASLSAASLNAASLSAASLSAASLNAAAASVGFNVGLNASLGGGLNPMNQPHMQLSQLAHHPLHHGMPSSLAGLNGNNVAAAAAAVAAAAVVAADQTNYRLKPAEYNKLNNFFSPTPLLATSLPGSASFLTPPNFTTENSYSKPSFINTMVTATLMEPQALDLSTHSRNKCKTRKPSLAPITTTSSSTTNTTVQMGPKILRHNSYRNLYKPYNTFRCTDDVVPRQGFNPRNPLWPL